CLSAEFRGARKAKRTMAMTTRNMPVRQDMRRPRTSAEASVSTTGFRRRRGEALPGADFGALLLGLLGTMLLSSATGDRGRVSQHLQVCRVRTRRARISAPWRVRFRPPAAALAQVNRVARPARPALRTVGGAPFREWLLPQPPRHPARLVTSPRAPARCSVSAAAGSAPAPAQYLRHVTQAAKADKQLSTMLSTISTQSIVLCCYLLQFRGMYKILSAEEIIRLGFNHGDIRRARSCCLRRLSRGVYLVKHVC